MKYDMSEAFPVPLRPSPLHNDDTAPPETHQQHNQTKAHDPSKSQDTSEYSCKHPQEQTHNLKYFANDLFLPEKLLPSSHSAFHLSHPSEWSFLYCIFYFVHH